MFPQLHVDIGLVNNVLENYYDLLQEKLDVEWRFDQLVAEQKQIEKPVQSGKREVTNKKAALKEATTRKQKVEKPIHVEIELLLNEYNIPVAAYHGGKLNGVECQLLMPYTSAFFSEIQAILLYSHKPERCTDSAIEHESELCQEILIVLDTICSKLCKKTRQAIEEDYNVLEVSIANLNFLWLQANLSLTPKLHSTLGHSLDHMKHFNGIGDMLADAVECIHQIATKIEARVSQMKNISALKQMCIQKWRPCKTAGRFGRQQKIHSS